MKKLLSFIFTLAIALPMFADVEAISVAEARARIDANNLGECYVRGKVKSINSFNPSYTNIIFWLSDTEDPTLEIQAYQFNAKDDKPYTSADQIEFKAGDEIIVFAKELLLYNGKTYEMKQGYYVSTVSSVQIDEISVSQALQRIKDNKLDPCIVSGKVLRFVTKDADVAKYGNTSYWLADLNNPNDSIQAYRMQGKNDTKYNSAADIEFVVGDEIQVFAKGLALYHNDNNNTDIPELNNGYYIKTLSGSDVVDLSWPDAAATAYRQEDHWTLEITKTSSDTKNAVNLVFALDQEDAIAGSHYLPGGSTILVNGTSQDITSGSLALTFKEISQDDYNVYDLQFSVVSNDKVYRFSQELEVFALDEDEEEIVLQGDRPFAPTEDYQEITCAQAREYTLSLPANASSELNVVITGYVTEIVTNFSNTFWMADTEKGGKVIEIFKFKELLPADAIVAKGAKVKVTGKVTHFVNGSGYSTPEIADAKVEVLSSIEIKSITVSEAITIGENLGKGETSTEFYHISGYITTVVEDYTEEYKNVTFWMSDIKGDEAQKFEAFRVKCDAAISELIKTDAHVTVTAQIQHYYKAATEEKPELETIEAVNGNVAMYGTGVEDITIDAKISKFIYEGQLYIINGNAIYNVQGQLVK